MSKSKLNPSKMREGVVAFKVSALTSLVLMASVVPLQAQEVGYGIDDYRREALNLEPESFRGFKAKQDELEARFIIKGTSKLPDDVTSDMSSSIDSAPWVLSTTQTPWPLNYTKPSDPDRMSIRTPSVNEVKLMLPGRVMDFIEHTRYLITKFIQDSIGVAKKERAQQLEQVNSWIEKVLAQRQSLPNAVWPVYQFSLDAREKAIAFQDKVRSQSDDTVEDISKEAQDLIQKLNEIMNVLPAEGPRNVLFDLMVRIKDGVEIYAESMFSGDDQVIQALDVMLERVPEIAKPDSAPPTESQSPTGGGWVEGAVNLSPSSDVERGRVAQVESDSQVRSSSFEESEFEPLPQMDPPKPSAAVTQVEESNSLVGYLIVLLAGAGVLGFFRRFFRRGKKVAK